MIHFTTIMLCYFLLLIIAYLIAVQLNALGYHDLNGFLMVISFIFFAICPLLVLINLGKTVTIYEEVEILKLNDRDMVMIEGQYVNLNKKFGKTFDEKSHAYRVYHVDTIANFIIYPDKLIVTDEPLQELNVHAITKRD